MPHRFTCYPAVLPELPSLTLVPRGLSRPAIRATPSDVNAQKLLDHMLTAPAADPQPATSMTQWWHGREGEADAWELPFDRAVAAALKADRVGQAFCVGYHSALSALLPELGSSHAACLCATEAQGNHPRAIETRLRMIDQDVVLAGEKTWATNADLATELLVVARVGELDGRPQLKLVRVPVDSVGVTRELRPVTDFVPELRHAVVKLQDVRLPRDAVLPGDGYSDYVKPFRTVEDIHVQGALLGYLVSVARRSSWPHELLEGLLAALLTLRTVAQLDPSSGMTHIALAGAMRQREGLDLDQGWGVEGVSAAERERWQRDAPLLQVAGKARTRRREVAWERIGTH